MSTLRTLLLTGAAMLAFAANSLLCRLALAQARIDPASFGSIRLASVAVLGGIAAVLATRGRVVGRVGR